MRFFAFVAPQVRGGDFRIADPAPVLVPEEFSISALVARGWVDKHHSGYEMALVIPRGAELRIPPPPDVLATKSATLERRVPLSLASVNEEVLRGFFLSE